MATRNLIGVGTARFSALGMVGQRQITAEERARLVAAHRARTPAPRPAPPPPTTRAPSRDECGWCGVPGFKGCDHYLPFEPVDVPPPPVAGGGPRRLGPSMTGRQAFNARGDHARELLAEIEQFLQAHDMRPSVFGKRVLNNNGFVFGLRDGAHAPKASTVAKVRGFIAAFKPAPVPREPEA